MTVLITGGTGFIGSHLIDRLLQEGKKIIVLKHDHSDCWRISKIIKNLYVYNFSELPTVDRIFKNNKIDAIIHLSGRYVKYEHDNKQIKEMNLVNIYEPSLLLGLAVKYKVRSFINTGTFFEYKQTNKKMTESSAIEAFNYYTATKLAFEQILKYYAYQKKIRAVSLKLFSPYGEKDNKKLIPTIIESFVKEKTLSLTKGEQRLSFTYVEDIVDAYIKTIEFINSSRYRQYENFNIGSDKIYSIRQIINYIRNIAGKKNHIKLGSLPYHKNEMMCARCDNSKAKKILSWHPKTDIITGLRQTYHSYKNQ